MPITKYKTLPLNLEEYDVYVEDTAINSDYFNITRLSDYFTGGRNSFLIGGSLNLLDGSDVLVEIKDANGKPIYQYVVKNYFEGGSVMVSAEIYDTTPSGFATVTIVGVLENTKDGQPIPSEWENKFNVRWSKKVLIDYELKNISPIKFSNNPQLSVTEKRFYNIESASYVTVQEPFTASLSPLLFLARQSGYSMAFTGSTLLEPKHLNGKLTGSLVIDGITSSVDLPLIKILNERKAYTNQTIPFSVNNGTIKQIYLLSGSYPTTVDAREVNISSSVLLQYNKINTSSVNVPLSYASLRVTNLATVSGEIAKIRVYSKIATNTAYYKIVGDIPVNTSEIFVSSSIRGDIPIGDISLANNYEENWCAGELELNQGIRSAVYKYSGSLRYYDPSISSKSLAVSSSNDILLSSIFANVPVDISTNQFSASIADTGYFIGTIPAYQLFSSTDYTLQLDAYYNKTSGSISLRGNTPKVDIYLINKFGETKPNTQNPLGQKIGEIKVSGNSQWFQGVQFNFSPLVNTSSTFALRFVVSNGFWNFSNISIKPASDPQFSPDETLILIPNTEYYNELLEYRVEFFDINNNSANVFAVSTPTYFSGSAIDLGVIP